MGKGLEQTLQQEGYTDRTQKHMKGCSVSVVIRKMQIKTTKRQRFTPVTMDMKEKPDHERKIPYDLTYKWNLINKTNKQAKLKQKLNS